MLEEEQKKDISSIAKRKQLAWPASTINSTLRTTDLIKYVVNKMNKYDLDKNEKKGFKGKSHFLNQPNFHFINDIPAEYMHLGCLGVIKRCLELTFNTGEKRIKASKRKLSEPEEFNIQIKKIKFLREFSRRCRNLDLSIIKAQEYRNIGIFFFPLVVNCISMQYADEKKIWLYLAYMLRSCLLPNEEFDEIHKQDVKNACKKFYTLFERSYGQKNCSYSIHTFVSHLLRIRGDNPLTSTSAFMYENYYSEMKNLFEAGTQSPLKQILENTLMKRIFEPHYCCKPITFSCYKDTGLENNSLIYIFNSNKEHTFYKIIGINNDGTFKCQEQGKFKYESELTPELNWSSVGVYNIGPSASNVTNVRKERIHGKLIKVDKFLITCPNNVLTEQ